MPLRFLPISYVLLSRPNHIVWWTESSFEATGKEGAGSVWKQRQFESICSTPSVSFRQWSAYVHWMLWRFVSNVQLHQELSETVPCHLFIISSVPLPSSYTIRYDTIAEINVDYIDYISETLQVVNRKWVSYHRKWHYKSWLTLWKFYWVCHIILEVFER